MKAQSHAAVEALRLGRVAIFPTESSYAIGCRIDSVSGKKEILRRKKRQDNRFTVIAASLYQVQKWFHLNKIQLKLAKKYWPGAVSLVVSSQLAIRVPDQASLRTLAKHAGAPLIASSLNIAGKPAIFDLRTLSRNFVDLPTLHKGKLPKKLPSTVVAVKNGQVIIIRPGAVHISTI